jgi:hypothetical protein
MKMRLLLTARQAQSTISFTPFSQPRMHCLASLIVHVGRSPRHLEYARTFQCLCSTNSHLLIDLHSNTTLLAFDSLVFRRRLTLLVEDTQPGQGREPSRASLPRTAAFRRSTTACRNILPSGKRACGRPACQHMATWFPAPPSQLLPALSHSFPRARPTTPSSL